MPETIEQYKARIMSNMEGKEPLEVLQATPRALAELIENRNADALLHSPQPGKWSVAQIIAHLSESEVVAFWRYRQMLESSGSNIIPYDQDVWENLGDYANLDPHTSLVLFRLLRERNLRLLERLTPEQWEMFGMHAERGKETVRHLSRMMAGHDINHLEQVRKLLS
ncbi:MAG: yfiT 2 [Acidobacteriales bacterium]|nr:yfiT 2 [Terriglobales bacterium]